MVRMILNDQTDLILLILVTGDATGMIVTRIAYGFLQGPLIPCIASIQIAWFPVEERGRINSIIFTGINVRK